LHASVDSGIETMVRLLVDYGADVNNAETVRGVTPVDA
jgi:hypothetical protein